MNYWPEVIDPLLPSEFHKNKKSNLKHQHLIIGSCIRMLNTTGVPDAAKINACALNIQWHMG